MTPAMARHETQTRLIRELKGTECRCGSEKQPDKTFCTKCYWSLPKSMRSDLYKRVGRGYEQAYERAVKFLETRR